MKRFTNFQREKKVLDVLVGGGGGVGEVKAQWCLVAIAIQEKWGKTVIVRRRLMQAMTGLEGRKRESGKDCVRLWWGEENRGWEGERIDLWTLREAESMGMVKIV